MANPTTQSTLKNTSGSSGTSTSSSTDQFARNSNQEGSREGMSGSDSMQGVKDNVERLTDEFRDRAGRIAGDVRERATEYYDEATDWLQENYGKTLMVVGVLAAVGLAGYFLARNNRQSSGQINRRDLGY
jgi:ElaB/YqjD/DUF883 family membrane-anchored ribosome-binding protein